MKDMIPYNQVMRFLLEVNESFAFTVAGTSMQPCLKEGYKVRAQPVSATDVRVGDIVVFGRDNLTVHRIVNKTKIAGKTYLVHKGDNALVGGVIEEDLVGRIVELKTEKGKLVEKKLWQNYSNKPLGILGHIYVLLYIMRTKINANALDNIASTINLFFWKLVRLLKSH